MNLKTLPKKRGISSQEYLEAAQSHFGQLRTNYSQQPKHVYTRSLVYSEVKKGKTTSLATLPRPLLIKNFDPSGLVPLKDLIDDPKEQIFVEHYDYENPDEYTRFKKELIYQRKNHLLDHIATVAVDSITTVIHSMFFHIFEYVNVGKGSERLIEGIDPATSDYKVLKGMAIELAGILLNLPCHVIVTGHMTERTDWKTGRQYKTINIPPATKDAILCLFSEIYIADVVKDKDTGDDLYIFNTRSLASSSLVAGSRGTTFIDGVPHPKLPAQVKQNFRLIFETLGLNFNDKEPL